MRLRMVQPPVWFDAPIMDGSIGRPRVYSAGDAWYATRAAEGWTMFPDGPEATRVPLCIAPEHEGQTPIIVVLPGVGNPWCLHSPTLGPAGWGSKGWTVMGPIESVTVHPSIDCGASFHGWITNGVIIGV